MTSCSYTLVLGDSEMAALGDALKVYAQHCSEQMEKGVMTPFSMHERLIQQIRAKLYERSTPMSRNNFQ
jgi:hypothetical protein